tara:strand:+ start:80 stop:448 length:369 start_codon:yes stop_codon:yes gene_type:complete
MINIDEIDTEQDDSKEKIIVARNNEVPGGLSKYIGVEVAVHVDLSSGQTYTVPSGKKLITSDVWSDNCLNINLTFPNGNTSITSNTMPENVNFLSPGTSISVNYNTTQPLYFYYLFGTLIND